MTHPTSRRRVVRVTLLAALLTMVAGLAGVGHARAASAIDIEARALLGGRYEVGGWLAISVSLRNEGEPVAGTLVAQTEAGSVGRFVEMPAGANKEVMLYVQPEAFQRRVVVGYEEPNGRVEASVQVSVLQQSDDQVAIVGDPTGTLRPQLLTEDGSSGPEPIVLGANEIPERPEPLGGLSSIVWAGDSAALTEAQRRAIERWVSDGGELVIMGGGDWQARTAAFSEMLPIESLGGVDGVALDALAGWSGESEPPVAQATVATGPLRDDGRALITSEDGVVLASMRSMGAGRVILIGTDLATSDFRGWAGSPRLWSRLLPTHAWIEQFMGGGMPARQEMENAMGGALGTIPSLDVPPAELLLGVIVAYILLIGPISYIVLRRVDRRELAWVTAPLLVVVFSACSYGIGRTMKGGDVVLNQIAVVRTATGASAATVDTFVGIVSPDRSTYDIVVEADALLGRVARQDGTRADGLQAEQGQPARLRGLTIPVFGFEAVRATGIADHQPALQVTWSTSDGEIMGTVTNTSDERIADVAFISSVGGERIGDLAPGASADFDLPGQNFNGSSAADQVYGFGGFDTADEEQRTITLRRQVIDALVGYASMGPVSTGSGRGPFVIGWRDGAGPMPVTVEGLQAQAYASAVEVLSVRPVVVSGEVTVQPWEMAVDVVATEGNAQPNGPGMILVGAGSATYSIALPIDATNLAASEVEIVVAPDPGMLVQDQGGGMGFWPVGFRIELQDPTTGEWRDLGDLSQDSTFSVDDAASAISSTGRIMVRISGVAVDPNFGQQAVFPSARVTGVLGE